jgi:hypothetical protein
MSLSCLAKSGPSLTEVGPERRGGASFSETNRDLGSWCLTETGPLREVTRQGRLLTLLNRREISARRGLIVSGPWATGKSTAIKQLGRAYELMVRERIGGKDRNQNGASDRIPAVYVTTPPKGSPRKLALEFARFLGLPPIRTSWNYR